jgi:hypothetical protein
MRPRRAAPSGTCLRPPQFPSHWSSLRSTATSPSAPGQLWIASARSARVVDFAAGGRTTTVMRADPTAHGVETKREHHRSATIPTQFRL